MRGDPLPPPDDETALVREALAGAYEILGELGRGGMAVVYHARERELDREVALKVLPLSRTFDADLVERFMAEARTAAALEHPHIIPIHRVGRAGRIVYFAMKLVRGRTLSRRLRDEGTLPPAEITKVLVEVGDALAYASDRGVVHRDIKPDNILQDVETGRYLVADFGIARSVDAERMTETGVSVGTPRYMSPEQATGGQVDGRSDLYSLGVVAYHCLAGRPPFDDGDSIAILYAHVNEALPRPSLPTPEARALYRVVERMLAKAPERRWSTAREMVEAVRALDAEPGARRSGSQGLLATAAAMAGEVAEAVTPQARRVTASLSRSAGRRVAWARGGIVGWLLERPARTVLGGVGAILVLWAGSAAVHVATAHRSRCAEVAGNTPEVLLDPVGTRPLRGDLDVYYDVCGLEAGQAYRVAIGLSKRAGGIGGLLGGRDRPLAVSFDEEARGPATRRHRTVELPRMEPGSYTLEVTITVEGGPSLSRRHDVQFLQ